MATKFFWGETTQLDLQVAEARFDDVFKDIVRINESYRKGLKAGYLYKIKAGSSHCYAFIRGAENRIAEIEVDQRLREKLGVSTKDGVVTFSIRRTIWAESLIWACTASDPSYRISAQVSIVSFVLGLFGLVIGTVPFWHEGVFLLPFILGTTLGLCIALLTGTR